jgi:ferritin-like metal-binding protein YciE
MLHHTAPLHASAVPHLQLCRLLSEQLSCIYRAEKQLFLILSGIQSSVNMVELKGLITDYTLQGQKQMIRLEEIFGLMLIPQGKASCDAMEGLVREIKRIINDHQSGNITRDTAVLVAIQKAIHYKIATYGSLEQLAASLGMEEVSNLLHLSLEDEKDNELTFADIAGRRVSWLAAT